MINKSEQGVKYFSLIVQKNMGRNQLPDIPQYADFGLRQKIFHHQICYELVLFNPFLIINETEH